MNKKDSDNISELLLQRRLTNKNIAEEDLRRIPEEEHHLIEDFLDKFVFISDASITKEQIDISLVLKSLPNKIEHKNLYRIELLNFSLIQKALIAF